MDSVISKQNVKGSRAPRKPKVGGEEEGGKEGKPKSEDDLPFHGSREVNRLSECLRSHLATVIPQLQIWKAVRYLPDSPSYHHLPGLQP